MNSQNGSHIPIPLAWKNTAHTNGGKTWLLLLLYEASIDLAKDFLEAMQQAPTIYKPARQTYREPNEERNLSLLHKYSVSFLETVSQN